MDIFIMLLKKHDDQTSIDECLLILSEEALRFLYLLSRNETDGPEFDWLAGCLNGPIGKMCDLKLLGLIRENERPFENLASGPSSRRATDKGERLIEYAISNGVNFEKLAYGSLPKHPF